MKKCSKCKAIKPLLEYYKKNGKEDCHCKVCHNVGVNARHLANPNVKRSGALRRRYGITIAQYEAMLDEQDHKCSICREPEKLEQRLAVDHCHETGKVRGLLCYSCNTKLGWYEKFSSGVITFLKKER